MSQVATTIRLDSELKREFDLLCQEFGMSVNTAFTIFAKAVVRTRSIPFDIQIERDKIAEAGRTAFYNLRQQAQSFPELTLEQVNEEIEEYRKSQK